MRRFKFLAKLLILIIAGGLSLSVAGFTNAMSGRGISVLPASTKEYPGIRSWFVYEAEPGTTIKDTVKISNNNNKTMTIKVMALDGATTNDGGYTLVGGTEENKDIGNWVVLKKDLITLPPGVSENINFTVTVPEDADVGSHPGGIVIWEDYTNESLKTKGGAGMLGVVTRVAARMYLTVPGDIVRSLEVENMHHIINNGILYFGMILHNKGNVQLTPEIDISLRGLFGKIGVQEKSQVGLVLRQGTIKPRIPWQNKTPFFGRFVANFRIHYGEKDYKGEYVKDEYTDVGYVFWIIPWIKILIGLGILILLYFLRNLWLWLTIQQRLSTKTKKHPVKKGENLSIIANLYNVNVKKIAKFNLLKWPYDLQEGDILLIPLGLMTKAERLVDKSIKTNQKISIKLEPVIVESGDTVRNVAEFADTTVKEIIEINHLHWPYRLKADQELLIPVKMKLTSPQKKKIIEKSKPKSSNRRKSEKKKSGK